MKSILLPSIALIAACFFIGCGSGQSSSSDTEALDAARRDLTAVTNQLLEAQMKQNHLEQTIGVLQLNITNQLHEMTTLSNNVSALKSQFAKAHEDTVAAQMEVTKRDVQIMELTAEKEALASKVKQLAADLKESAKQAPAYEAKLAQAAADKVELQREIEQLKIEITDWSGLFNNRMALEQRLKALKLQAKPPAGKAIKKSASLQPDGSVTLLDSETRRNPVNP